MRQRNADCCAQPRLIARDRANCSNRRAGIFHKMLIVPGRIFRYIKNVHPLKELFSMNTEDQPYDPFADFINMSLDMQGIEGLDQAALAERVRHIVHDLPSNVTSDLWNDRLTSLQSAIRVCLDLNTVISSFPDSLDPAQFNRDDLETLVMLSITFAFVSFNQLHPTYSADDAAASDTALLARRLRDTLLVSLGWVKRAAQDGDPVAARMIEEASALLKASEHLD
jgi:hypothetical protein